MATHSWRRGAAVLARVMRDPAEVAAPLDLPDAPDSAEIAAAPDSASPPFFRRPGHAPAGQSGRWLTALAGAVALAVSGSAAAQSASTLVAVAAHGNFHAAGVVATISGDVDGDASALLEWRRGASGAFRPGHPLVRVDATRFVGSLFELVPGVAHQVRITLVDPDGVTAPATRTADFATRPPGLREPTVRTLFVAPGGDDGNPGTDPGAPLATIQAAAARVAPGDRVSIAPGTYRESVVVTTSGTAAQPIVFRGSGPGVVLDGADAAIAAGGVPWTSGTGGTWSLAIAFATGHAVTDQGRLFRYDSLADLQALAAGPPGGFFVDGSTLRVKFSDGSPPTGRTIHVARLEDGFRLDGVSHVRVENLEIRHYGAGDYGKGVYLRFASDSTVRNCRIHEVGAAGVWVKGGARNLIEGNEILDTSIPGWDWNWTKGSSAENNAIVFTDDIGRGNVVRRNDLRGTFNGVGPCGSLPPPAGFTSETDLYENLLSDHNDDAFEPEGWCANVRMWDNVIADVHMAFAVAPAYPGPTWIVRNVARDFGSTRTSQQDGYTASVLKINSGYPQPVGPLLVYHNSFWTSAPNTPALALLNPGESTWIRARNNVFAATSDVFYKVNPVTVDFDRDALWRSTSGRLAYWEGATYPSLPDLRAGSGQELSGFFADPAFAAPAAGDFTPLPSSPLVDSGAVLPGVNDSPIGDPPDVGAVERSEIFADGFDEGSAVRWSLTFP